MHQGQWVEVFVRLAAKSRPLLLTLLSAMFLCWGAAAVAAAEQAPAKKAELAAAAPVAAKKSPKAPAADQAPAKKPPPAAAVQVPAKTPPAATAVDKGKKDDKERPLPPQDVTLPTSDGVQIVATYFPGTKGKESVPVVLLHMLKGSRKDYADLARYLQSQGHAVLVPDLRGHGDSTVRTGYRSETVDAAKLSPQQFALMAKWDMKAVREFLWNRHNAGELNLNKLCLVGAEMGAAVAVGASVYDAAGYGEGNPPGNPYYGPLQLGRFVKAVVLLSPEWAFKGLPIADARKNPAVLSQIAVMIVVGAETPKALAEAKRIQAIFKPHHLEPEGDNKAEKKTLFLAALKTSLQGTKLLNAKELHVNDSIGQFISLRLIKNAEASGWTWKELKRPHQ